MPGSTEDESLRTRRTLRRRSPRVPPALGPGWHELADAGRAFAGRADRAGPRTRAVDHPALAGGRSKPARNLRPPPRYRGSPGGRGAIATAVKGVELAEGFGRLAEVMADVSLVRSMVSKEGDHERGTYLMKSGYRPDATVEHPSIGAICCHELPAGTTEIPRHISILPSQWPARGASSAATYDAFQADDPLKRLPDVTPFVTPAARRGRTSDLDVVERAFGRGRTRRVAATLHMDTIRRARAMMSSEQLKAFDITQEPVALRREYGDTPFGRACLAARRLTEVGVRCVEVNLVGWDTHVNNHETHRNGLAILDPGLHRADPRPETARSARSDRRRLRGRVRPDPQDQPARGPRPLAQRLQYRARRRRHPGWPGHRRDRP